MRETNFQNQTLKSIRKLGWLAYKIPDMPKGPLTRFIPPKPCDIIADLNGFTLIECKLFKKLEALTADKFSPSQLAALDEAVQKSLKAFVFLNFKAPAGLYTPRRVNAVLILNWKEYGPKIRAAGIDKNQILELVEQRGIPINGEIFDLKPLFGLNIFG